MGMDLKILFGEDNEILETMNRRTAPLSMYGRSPEFVEWFSRIRAATPPRLRVDFYGANKGKVLIKVVVVEHKISSWQVIPYNPSELPQEADTLWTHDGYPTNDAREELYEKYGLWITHFNSHELTVMRTVLGMKTPEGYLNSMHVSLVSDESLMGTLEDLKGRHLVEIGEQDATGIRKVIATRRGIAAVEGFLKAKKEW